jgi:two-component system sensor histidine kinase/response regulator
MAAKPTISLTANRWTLLRGALLLALAAVLAVHFQYPTDVAGDSTYLAVGWAAAVVAWIGAGRAPRGARLVPLLIAAGITASASGDLAYRVYQWTGTATDISLADIPWVLQLPRSGRSVVHHPRARGRTQAGQHRRGH